MNKSSIVILFTTIIMILLTACGVADGGKVTAREVLKQNEDADIIKYDGKIFSNVTYLEWFEDTKEEIPFSKNDYVGEVTNQTANGWFFSNLNASKLPKSTKIYSASVGGILLIEYQGKELYYMALLEG